MGPTIEVTLNLGISSAVRHIAQVCRTRVSKFTGTLVPGFIGIFGTLSVKSCGENTRREDLEAHLEV